MIELNPNTKTILEFELNIENTFIMPSKVRLHFPITENLSLSLDGFVISKKIATFTVPKAYDFPFHSEIKKAILEIIMTEDNVSTIFEVLEEEVFIKDDVRIKATLKNVEEIKEEVIEKQQEETIKAIEEIKEEIIKYQEKKKTNNNLSESINEIKKDTNTSFDGSFITIKENKNEFL